MDWRKGRRRDLQPGMKMVFFTAEDAEGFLVVAPPLERTARVPLLAAAVAEAVDAFPATLPFSAPTGSSLGFLACPSSRTATSGDTARLRVVCTGDAILRRRERDLHARMRTTEGSW